MTRCYLCDEPLKTPAALFTCPHCGGECTAYDDTEEPDPDSIYDVDGDEQEDDER